MQHAEDFWVPDFWLFLGAFSASAMELRPRLRVIVWSFRRVCESALRSRRFSVHTPSICKGIKNSGIKRGGGGG